MGNEEKRQHQRFSDTTLLYHPIEFLARPPIFDETVNGNLVNISSGGLAVLINHDVPLGVDLELKLIFPDKSIVDSVVRVARVVPNKERFEVGLIFINLPDYMRKKIDKMSADFNSCEERIARKEETICDLGCAYYVICKKEQKSLGDKDYSDKLVADLHPIED